MVTPPSCLWYRQPATCSNEALPIGNGRLDAMVYGRVDRELLQLNDDSVWYGGAEDRTPDASRHLSRLRALIRASLHAEADKLMRRAFSTRS